MDKYKLLYIMKKKGISIDDMCNYLGIGRSTFYKKCNGSSQFTLAEIQKIMDILELDSPMGIFFELKVS